MAAGDPTFDVATPRGVLQGVAVFTHDGTNWQPTGRAATEVATPTGVLRGVAAFSGGPNWAPVARAQTEVPTPSGVLDGVAVYTWSGTAWVPPSGNIEVATPSGVLEGVAQFSWDGTTWQPAAQAGAEVPTPYGVLTGVAPFTWDGSKWVAGGSPSFDINFMNSTLGAGAVFTRASTGTYYNASGVLVQAAINTPRFDYDPATLQPRGLLLEDASTNLCLQSGDLTTGWVFSNTTISVGTDLSPNGTQMMSKVAETTTTTTHYIAQTAITVTSGQMYTLSCFVKASTVRYFQLVFDDVTNGTFVTFDMQTGTISQAIATRGTGVTAGTASITSVGNGIWRCTVSGTVPSTAGRVVILLVNGPTPGFAPVYTGNTANVLSVWGAQIEALPYMSSHIPTTSVSVTRAQDVLLYPAAALTGLLPTGGGSWFADFDYIKPPTVSRIIGPGATPGGSATTPMYMNGGGDFVNQYDGIASINPTNTTSRNVITKAVSTWVAGQAKIAMNGGAVVSSAALTNGYSALATQGIKLFTVANPGVPDNLSGHIRALKYWPRVLSDSEMQAATTLAGPTLSLDFMSDGTLDPRITFTRTSSATYTDASGVVQTAATNAPRWDYASGVLRGLLIEEVRTNVWLNSGDLSNVTTSGGGVGVAAPTRTGNNVIAPDGTMTGTRAVYPAVVSAGQVSSLQQSPIMAAAVYTFSVWLRGNVGGEVLWLSTTPDGVLYYRQQCTLTTAWQRFTLITGTLTATGWFWLIGTDRRDASQTATPAQTIYVWGADVQQGAFPTSYIPTTSVSVTRAADVAVMPTNVSWFASPGGSWFAEFIQLNTGGANTRIIGAAVAAGGGSTPLFSNPSLLLSQYDNAAAVSAANAITANTVSKGASNWVSGTGRVCLNGGAVASGAMANGFASLTTNGIKFFTVANPGVADNGSGYIRRVNYWTRALSDTELQQVTT